MTEQLRYVLDQSESRLNDEAIWTPIASLTFEQLEDRSRRVANGLHARGVGSGQAYGILATNCVEWPELVLGNVRAHTRYVPLNWHLTAGEIAELLVDSGSRLLIDGQRARRGRPGGRRDRGRPRGHRAGRALRGVAGRSIRRADTRRSDGHAAALHRWHHGSLQGRDAQ